MTRLRLHLATALLAVLGIVPGSLSQTYNPAQNPYDAKALELRQGFAEATGPAKAVALARSYALRNYLTDTSALTHWFEGVARDASADQLVRDEALRYVALMNLHAGNLTQARTSWDELGVLRSWSVIGPFLQVPEGLKAGPQATAEYKDRGVVRSWRALPDSGVRGTLDLSRMFPDLSSGTVLAATSVRSETAGTKTLRWGANAVVTIFVNGQQVARSEDEQFGFDQHSVSVELQAGLNSVVLELRNASLMSVRLTSSPVDDLLTQAQRMTESQRNSAESLDILGELYQARGIAGAHDPFERAARLSPSAERWLRVASTCADSHCKFAALSAAQSAGRDNAEVLGRLAEYYMGRRQTQKARMLLTKAIGLAPDDFVLREHLAELYFSVGLNADGLNELRKLELQFPRVTWIAKQAAPRYEELGLRDHALVLETAVLAREFDDASVREDLAAIYAKRQDAAKLSAILSDNLKLDPLDIASLAKRAQIEAGGGNIRSAETELRAAIAVAPENRDLQQQLAELGGTSIVSEQAKLPSKQDRGSDPDESYVVRAGELARLALKNPPEDAASTIELANVRVERLAENGTSTVRTQQVVYIGSEQGAREYATRTVTYAAGAQKLQVVRARVFKADGRVITAEELNETAPSEALSAMYYDTVTRTFRYPSVEKGDVVELDYRLAPETTANPYGDYFGELVTFGSSAPRKLQRYVLIAPASRTLHITEERLTKAAESKTPEEHVYTWEMHNLAALSNEPRGPATTEVAPYVHVSTFATWNQVGRWYAQLIAPQFRLDVTLREVLAKIIAGKMNDEEKITAIHQFVLRNTHYVALEFGVFSYKPYPVSQVYARRFGDCKDKASLMIALLRASGIDADMALVRTRRLGDVAGEATSVSIFNHAVVYIPKHDLWLDGTAEYAGSHELPLDDQGAQALTVALDGQAQLRRIPVTLPMENYTHRQVRAQVRPDGRIQFTGSAYTRGEDAPGLRREYEVAERQRANFRNRLAEVLPAVRLDSVEVNGAHDLESDVIVNFSGDLDTYAGRRTVSLTPSWMTRSYVQTLAPLGSRKQDMVLPAPWTTEEELHFELPSGARIEALPQDTNLETPFGMATVRYQKQGNEVVVKTSVQFRKLRITAEEYKDFRSFCSEVENAFRSEIKVGL